MKFEKHYSKTWKCNYLTATIPQSEIEGLQGDLTIVLQVERKSFKVPTIGWKMTIDGQEYGGFVETHVNL